MSVHPCASPTLVRHALCARSCTRAWPCPLCSITPKPSHICLWGQLMLRVHEKLVERVTRSRCEMFVEPSDRPTALPQARAMVENGVGLVVPARRALCKDLVQAIANEAHQRSRLVSPEGQSSAIRMLHSPRAHKGYIAPPLLIASLMTVRPCDPACPLCDSCNGVMDLPPCWSHRHLRFGICSPLFTTRTPCVWVVTRNTGKASSRPGPNERGFPDAYRYSESVT